MKIKNKGKQLKKALKKRGVSKIHVSKLLGIARTTLERRFIDGEFDENHLEILKKNNLI